MNTSYIDELERQLLNFSSDWEEVFGRRVIAWRVRLLAGIVLSLLVPLLFPNLYWVFLIVLGMSAGSLFVLLKSNAKMQKHIHSCRDHIRNARIQDEFSG